MKFICSRANVDQRIVARRSIVGAAASCLAVHPGNTGFICSGARAHKSTTAEKNMYPRTCKIPYRKGNDLGDLVTMHFVLTPCLPL